MYGDSIPLMPASEPDLSLARHVGPAAEAAMAASAMRCSGCGGKVSCLPEDCAASYHVMSATRSHLADGAHICRELIHMDRSPSLARHVGPAAEAAVAASAMRCSGCGG